MNRLVSVLDKQSCADALSGMIRPDILPALEEEFVFLVGAMEGEKVLGAAVAEFQLSQCQLLSIAVAEDRRREGIATALLRECGRIANQLSCESITAVLSPDDTVTAALLASFGMKLREQPSRSYQFTLSQVLGKLPRPKAPHTIPLGEVPGYLYDAFVIRQFDHLPDVMESKNFHPTLSRLIVDDNQVTDCILMEPAEGGISVAWIQTDTDRQRDVLYLLQDAMAAAEKLLPGDTRFQLLTDLPAIQKLVEKLSGGQEVQEEREWVLEDMDFRDLDLNPGAWVTAAPEA